MPYEKGGRADKKGNKYEINCIVYELLKVLDGSNYSVVIEALGEDEKGTDILVTNHEGKKEHQQCKARNGSSDNWTISDLKARKIFNAWKIQLDRECDRKVALVSPMTCSFLVDLNDRANNTSGKAEEFYDFQIMNSSKEFQSFYENFCKEMNIEIGRESGILKSIDYLKRIYYKQISEYEIQELITQNIQYQFSSPKDMVYDAFVSMIVSKDILGRELTQIALIDYIEKKNIKFQLREDDGRIGFRIKELNQEYRESFRTLQEGLIHRKEFDNCIKYIMDGKGVVITGNAGYGKSGCTEAILNFCEDANIPCIAIKLDRRIPHKNCKNWGEELGLPGSIAYCIHTISRNENAIIILDQLDALRWTQSNSSEALSICMELIRQVECLNYNRAKKISIVFVCRTYDFENDNNIRALFENREREEEIWKVIEIGKFVEETVGRIVGDIYKDLSVKLKSLLQIPSNLYIWQHLDKKQIYGECLTTSNLIDKWFDQICKRSTEVGISSKLVADTTNKIVDTLDGMGRLFAPKMIINIDITGLEYLISAEIIVLQNNKIGFVHQSILDYFVSKRMMEKHYAGQSIEDIMGEKEKQTPGKRYQLQMFLQNILEVDTEEFVLIGEELLWMFLSSYENMRKDIIMHNTIVNMVHPGRGIFGSDFGTTAFVVGRKHIDGYKGCYRRLFDKQVEVESIEIRKEQFLQKKGCYNSKQDEYLKIPGNPIAYWVTHDFIASFKKGISIDSISLYTGSQNITANNEKYLRYFWEVKKEDIGKEESHWAFYIKGGPYRKWYGNIELVVDWSLPAKHFYKNNSTSNLLGEQYRFKEGITYTELTSGVNSFRYLPPVAIFDKKGPCIVEVKHNLYCLAFFNSKVAVEYFKLLNPTITLQVKDVKNTPIIIDSSLVEQVEKMAKQNVELCKWDWDLHETSWDFEKNVLIQKVKLISEAYSHYEEESYQKFIELKRNEEKLNSIFISIYKLNNEIISEVEDKDITIQKADLSRGIKEFISYVVGCMFGRYSLGKTGLIFAGEKWNNSNYQSFIPDSDNCIPITDEEYFSDDIVARFVEFVKIVYGADTLEENLEFIAKALGNKGDTSREIIRNYFLKDFYTDHLKVYQKRPIYWLFDSGKQNGFKALIYMHRYDADTVGRVRTDYLHRAQKYVETAMQSAQYTMRNI